MSKIMRTLSETAVLIASGITIGYCAISVVTLIKGNELQFYECLKILIYVTVSAVAALIIARVFITKAPGLAVTNAINAIQSGKDPCKAIDKAKKGLTKCRSYSEENHYMLLLASLYNEAEMFDECLDILRDIDLLVLDSFAQNEYFNVYMYSYLMKGDIENAERVYSQAQPYFERCKDKKRHINILHTIGVYEYAKGNYGQSEAYLMQAKSKNKSKQFQCDCNLYLALCCLKTDRLEEAKALYIDAADTAVTALQRKNTEKLAALTDKIISAKAACASAE